MMPIKKFVFVSFLLMSIWSQGQEHTEKASEEFHHHAISFLICHTTIFEGVKAGEKTTVSVPSWALNYNYVFNRKWSLGLHNDIIIEDFIIEKTSGGETIERSVPIASLLVGTYKLTESFGIEIGGGMEFEKNESFALARIGAEYSIEIPNRKLEVLFALDYDLIFDAYNSLNIGIGLAKLF